MQKRMGAILEHAATLSHAVLPTPSGTPAPDFDSGLSQALAAGRPLHADKLQHATVCAS